MAVSSNVSSLLIKRWQGWSVTSGLMSLTVVVQGLSAKLSRSGREKGRPRVPRLPNYRVSVVFSFLLTTQVSQEAHVRGPTPAYLWCSSHQWRQLGSARALAGAGGSLGSSGNALGQHDRHWQPTSSHTRQEQCSHGHWAVPALGIRHLPGDRLRLGWDVC